MQRKYTKKEHFAHRGLESGTGATHDDGGRMLGAPPANRSEDNRDIDEREYTEEGAQKRPAIGFLDQRSQKQVGDVEKPKHKCGSEPRIPGPVDSPRWLGPNRSCD